MDTKSCSFCKEEISIGLRRCPYCGSLLKQEIVIANKDSQNSNSDVNVAQMCVEQNDDGTIVIKECEELPAVKDMENTDSPEKEKVIRNQVLSKFADINALNKGLGNGLKVFLTIIATVIPGLGQLIGIIISVIFINSEDPDKNSFGVALMAASLLFFIISCISVFILILALAIK